MTHTLLAWLFMLPPQSTLPAAPPQSVIADEWSVALTADPWNYWQPTSELDSMPANKPCKGDVTIYRGSTAYVTLSRPTVGEVRSALAKAKAGKLPFADGAELPVGSVEALELVNAQRAARGLRPYLRDVGLTLAAANCAVFRAARGIAGHCGGQMGDFAFLPRGSWADAAGCAAWADGFGACAMFDDYRFAGAAFVVGPDGLRYCHVFYRR